jgi:alanyl aminopeptidase
MIFKHFPALLVGITAFLSILAGCSESPAPPEGQSVTAATSDSAIPVGQLGMSVVPSHYNIELRIDPSEDSFSGLVSIDITLTESTDQIWLHGKNLEVSDVHMIDSQGHRIDATYEQRHPSGVALVTLGQVVDAGQAVLHFTYDAPFNTGTKALFKAVRGSDSYAVTQFEATGARQVFPGFDEPAFKVPFDLTFVTRADDVVVTTTPEASAETLDDGFVRHIFETTRPLPTYLLAIAVGPYDLVDYGTIPANDIRDRELPLRAIAARGQGDRLQYALKNTDGMLTVLEEYFGTPYPYKKLDLIAMPEGFGGAMENVGAITYDEYLLLMDENSPLQQRRLFTTVHAHELGHMWFGNVVTPHWWNDIWLNESFASWIHNKAAHMYWPEGEFDRETLKDALFAMSADSLVAAREIREPIDHNDKIDGAFDQITYEKGGGVLAMLERYVGEDRFQAGVRLHIERHTDSTATAEDFIESLAEGTERTEIEAAFMSYIQQPGVPLLSVQLDCEDEQDPHLNIHQARYAPLGSAIEADASEWHVPMCVNFTVDGVQKSSCALVNQKTQLIPLDADSCPTEVHPNSDGTGYYRFSLDDAGWQNLIASVPGMAAGEALVLGDSLDAAFRAGTVATEIYVSGMAALVNHDTWDVADAATDHLEAITPIIDDSELEVAQTAFRKIVKPRFASLGDASDSGSQLLHRRMQRFLIVVAKDPQMRKALAEQAEARMGLYGDPDPSAAPAGQLETILSVGVQDLGARFFDLLLAETIASQDPAFRQAATGALARVEEPELVGKLQAALLDGNFQGTELLRMIARQLSRNATTDLTFNWLRKNDEQIISLMPESFRSMYVPAFGGYFCDAVKAAEWEAFIKANADSFPGYERTLAQGTETSQLCSALREARAAELVNSFANYR